MPLPNEQTFKIPSVVLIIAFVASLLGLAGWSLNLERSKVGKEEIGEVKAQMVRIESKVDRLLSRGGSNADKR